MTIPDAIRRRPAAIPAPATPSAVRTPPQVPKDPPPQLADSPRIGRLADELRTDPHAATTRFWAEARDRGTPLVEPSGDPGERIVTFLWRDRHGDGDGTRTVLLMANKLTDPTVLAQSTLERLPATDVWFRSYRLPADWRGSYRIAADDGASPVADAPTAGPTSRWRAFAPLAVADPLNPQRLAAAEPGAAPWAVAELPAAPPQPWRQRRPGVPRGTLDERRVASRILGNERAVWTYVPPVPAPRELPVVVVLDGEDWAGRLDLRTTLDNLIADGRVPPLAAALVSAVDLETRWRELSGHPPFLAFLADELLPWLAARLPITARPDRTVLTGRSLGGLTALYAGLRGHGRFGAVLAQSASLWSPVEGRPLIDLYAAAPHRALRTVVEVGRDEWVLLDAHRRLHETLDAKRYPTTYREYSGGHDAACWRGGIADGLIALLGD